jgi:hypothetical protein
MRTISRTCLPLTSAMRPPTWNEPMPRSTMSSAIAEAGNATNAANHPIRIRRMMFLPCAHMPVA